MTRLTTYDPSTDDAQATTQRIAAFMPYDQQGIAMFLGGGDVTIIADDGAVTGNVTPVNMGTVTRAVVVARLRAIADVIEAAT